MLCSTLSKASAFHCINRPPPPPIVISKLNVCVTVTSVYGRHMRTLGAVNRDLLDTTDNTKTALDEDMSKEKSKN